MLYGKVHGFCRFDAAGHSCRHQCGGAHLQSVLGGHQRGSARGFQIHPDDQGPRPSRTDRVGGRRGAAEPLVDLEFGIQTETSEQHRGVTAFQPRKVTAHQHDALDRSAGFQCVTTGFDGEGDDVLVVAGHPVLGVTPARQVGTDRSDVGHGLCGGPLW